MNDIPDVSIYFELEIVREYRLLPVPRVKFRPFTETDSEKTMSDSYGSLF